VNCEPRDCAGAIDVREFPAVTAKAKITAGWSSLQFDPYAAQRYRHADNIIAGRSLTGHAITL